MAEPEKNFLQQTIGWFSGAIASVEDLAKRVGWPRTVLIVLAAAGGFIWWNWDEIAKRPEVERVLRLVEQRPLPKATAGHLTIAVTHLARDNKDREHEGILLDELRHFEVEGVEVLPVDRTIDPEEPAKKNAEDKAQDLLKKSGADVLIWGSVINLSGKSASAMRLNWTRARDVPGAKASGKYQLPTETIALPPEFWSDLKQILGLLTQSRLAELTFGGQYVAAKLEPLIAQVRALVQSKEGVWDPEIFAGVQFSLAAALEIYGEQSGMTEPLAESLGLYRKVLDEWTRDRVPLQWATTQNKLGLSLEALGERERGTARLEEAVTAFREASQERTRERVPLDWAMTLNNLGNALLRVGQRESGTARLEEAVAAYSEALKEFTRARVPLDWAMTQNGLGTALLSLGERESGTARLEEAVAAYRDTLQENTRARVPLRWAATQNNLGVALATLGERESGTARLDEAVAAYREALQERTRARVPLDWAMTQMNLGNALRVLGEREGGTAKLEEAVAAFREALQENTRARVPLQWATTQNDLGNALRVVGEREGGTARLEEAVEAYREALQEFTCARVPLDWATSTGNQGVALMLLAERLRGVNTARLAVKQIEAAFTASRDGGNAPSAAFFEAQLAKARAVAQKLATR